MERIEALIRRLKEQFEQNTDPSILLGTVQLLQFELTKLRSDSLQSLGTAKVAVTLPQTTATGIVPHYEKYAPKPAEPVIQEVNDTGQQAESLNDKLKQGKTELIEVLKETPVKDLRKAVGINDRFLFINELFRGDENMYERSIKTINSFNIYAEAEYWINRELKVKLAWNNGHDVVQHFDQLVKRRFS